MSRLATIIGIQHGTIGNYALDLDWTTVKDYGDFIGHSVTVTKLGLNSPGG